MDGPSVNTTEAASVPATIADAAADFENYLFPEEQDETNPETEGEPEEGELEIEDEEAGEEEGEPEQPPAIAPPPSLNAEEKAAFLAASPEAQQAWSAAETRRNTQVQEATTKAANAQREAEATAARADAEAGTRYAQQLDQFVKAFEPQAPDPQLAYQNPAQYIAEKAQYDALKAQHDTLVQQVQGIGSQAQQAADQAFLQQRDREILSIPQIANAETRDDYVKGIMGMAQDAGFDPDQIAKHATGTEFKALAKFYDRLTTAEDKAAKYDKAMARQMQKVRASKGRNLRPNAAPQEGTRAAAGKDWQRVTTAKTKEAQAEAFADWMDL